MSDQSTSLSRLAAEMKQFREENPRISIVCDRPTHTKQWRVVEFWRAADGRWYESHYASAQSRREAALTRPGPDADWLEEFLHGPKADRPARGVRLRGDSPSGEAPGPKTADIFGTSPDAQEVLETLPPPRDVWEVRCPHRRCGDGRRHRAEKLDPVLSALHDADKFTVTIRELWRWLDWADGARQR